MADSIRKGWALAKGSAGYNVAGDVYGAHVNGVALFAFQHAATHYKCVVTGHLTTGGATLSEAMERGEGYAREYGARGPDCDRRLTRKQFQARMENPERLPVYDADGTPRLRVVDLRPGMRVDLERDKFADPPGQRLHPEFEFEFERVAEVEPETPDCVVVHFESGFACGFPPGHVVALDPEQTPGDYTNS